MRLERLTVRAFFLEARVRPTRAGDSWACQTAAGAPPPREDGIFFRAAGRAAARATGLVPGRDAEREDVTEADLRLVGLMVTSNTSRLQPSGRFLLHQGLL